MDILFSVLDHLEQGYSLLIFLGEVALILLRSLLNPRRLRINAMIHDLKSAGVEALPIVGLISFLMGTVIAYQGGAQLSYYGANLFVVDLVGVTLLRELAPLLTAIIVAGRTGSAYTAQIGTMRVTDEIDALRTLGIDPLELLVIPKIFALLLVLPLLTVYADILGVLGGMVMAHIVLGVDPYGFLARFSEAVSVVHYYGPHCPLQSGQARQEDHHPRAAHPLACHQQQPDGRARRHHRLHQHPGGGQGP